MERLHLPYYAGLLSAAQYHGAAHQRPQEFQVFLALTAPVPWAQRLGYILEHLGFDEKTRPLKEYVRSHARQSAVLLPKAPRKRSRNKGWKLCVNAKIEVDP